ncbi:MAG TPA: hypothetical protein VGG29_04000 [Caulobacteraceae bacterium]|jgi:hypothetical protein
MNEDEVFIGGVTRASLRSRSQNERYALWKRAKSLHSAEGNHLARAIELLGLPYAEPEPLAGDDPLLMRMREIMAAPRARAAAVEATLDGLPAMAGIDVMMHEELAEAYRRNEAAVPTARLLTAELMTGLGYHEAGAKELPARCVARTGVFWRK